MARVQFQLDEDLMQKLRALEAREIDEACRKACYVGGHILLDEVRHELTDKIGSHPQTKRDKEHGSRSTGELVKALGCTPVRINYKGEYDVKIGFNEPRKNRSGKRDQTNAKIATVLEYGKTDMTQPPRPFLAPAVKKVRKKVLTEMESILSEAIEKA